MASVVYPKTKEAALQGQVDLANGDVRVILVDLDVYTYDAAHDFLDDVAAGARVAVSSSGLTSKTFTNGVFDAANTTLTGVAGAESEALIVYLHTGTESTSRVVCFIDSYTGFPLQANPGNVEIQWPAGGIFEL